MTKMGEPEFKLEKRHEWIFKGRSFGISVNCHSMGGADWTWCLYALIYDNHPLFKDPEAAVERLPWHCGCTYENRFTQEPALGIRYDWQREVEWLKIGADYAHLHDDHFRACAPADGIPGGVVADARELFAALAQCQEES